MSHQTFAGSLVWIFNNELYNFFEDMIFITVFSAWVSLNNESVQIHVDFDVEIIMSFFSIILKKGFCKDGC